MKFFILPLTLLALVLLSSGCAIGPLTYNETGHTVGKGRNELSVGLGLSGYSLKFSHGLSENFDLGLQLESLNWSVRGKYALTQNGSEGFASSVGGNFGTGFFGTTLGGDVAASYKIYFIEPYSALRFTYVSNGSVDSNSQEQGNQGGGSSQPIFNVRIPDYAYSQIFLGNRFWLGKNWFIGAEASTLLSFNSSLTFGTGLLIGLNVGGQF